MYIVLYYYYSQQLRNMENIKTDDNSVTAHEIPTADSTTVNIVSAPSATITVPHLRELNSDLKNTGRSGPEQTLKSFLARPVVLARYNLGVAPGDPDNSDPIQINIPKDLTGYYVGGVLTGGIDLIKAKIQGFLGFRSDFTFKVQVNANQFQQGLLLLRFVPFTDNLSTEVDAWNYSLVQKTQHFSTVLDLSCDTEVEMTVPFRYAAPYYNYMQENNTENLGTFYVTVYSSLRYGTGSATAEITVWGSMDNVELIGPVIPLAQSSDFKLTKRTIGVSDEEKRSAGSEKQSSSLGIATSAVANLTSKIPLISSFATPLRWFSKMVDEPAAYFGLSVPNMTIAPSLMTQRPLAWYNNSDQPRLTQIIGVNSDNSVGHLPGFAGTDFDEMTIQGIAQRYAYHKRFTWDTDDAADAQLTDLTLRPDLFYNTGTSGSYTIYNYAPVGYVSKMFRMWRGGIKIKFIVVKTNFHSGRMLVSFIPGQFGTYSPVASMNSENSQYLYRQIIDIREGNTFEIEIPFICTSQWLDYEEMSGYLAVRVLNPLRAPDTVSPSVDVIMEVAGADDIEFSVPKLVDAAPWTPTVYTPALMDTPLAQSSNCVISKTTIGAAEVMPDNGMASAYCTGEKLTSLRQIVKKLGFLRNTVTTTTTAIDIAPFGMYGMSQTDTGTLNDPPFATDSLSYIGTMFALQRGGIQYVLDNTGSTRIITTLYSETGVLPYRTTDLTTLTYQKNLCVANTILSTNNEYMTPVYVPSYSYNHSRFNHWFVDAFSVTQDNKFTSPLRLNVNRNVTAAPRIWRAAGDDFSFGYFVACPPLILPY